MTSRRRCRRGPIARSRCAASTFRSRTVGSGRWAFRRCGTASRKGRRRTTHPRQGTPQGGVISPLLANIYLHDFDRAFHSPDGPAQFAKARLVRYADDFVVLARYLGPRLVAWLERTLEQDLRLTV